MTQDLFQEMTGVQLLPEKEEYLTDSDFNSINMRFHELPTYNNFTKENNIWEFYFIPEEACENKRYQDEEYLVSVTTADDIPCISLKKRSKFGDFISEKAAGITRAQFKKLLQENYEWMKHSGELLLLELYNKFKLFRMKLGLLMECIRREIYYSDEKLLVTLDHYRALPGGSELFNTNPLYRHIRNSAYRITVKDLGSNYQGMGCREILHALSAV